MRFIPVFRAYLNCLAWNHGEPYAILGSQFHVTPARLGCSKWRNPTLLSRQKKGLQYRIAG
jgi:hypothetical protein